ncbi:helix-turn-helix domain-containing protein [Dactylosporangium sp. CS-047395]|uniref:helix-turn-helix domain-containing protein n=1 Tax=Dactylosporangium sp. CS-047395 TaxID=3239936 RepID=UPI003D94EED5
MARRRAPGRLGELPVDLSDAQASLVQELRLGRDKADASLHQLANAVYSSKASVSRWLNGHARPSLDQAERWAEYCGTSVATMRQLWLAAQTVPTAQPAATPETPAPPPDPPEVPTPPAGRRWLRVVGVAALVLVIAVVAGVIMSDRRSEREPEAANRQPAWCGGRDLASVDVPPTTVTTSTVTVHIACAPPGDDQLILMVELLEQGEPPHPEFFAKEYLDRPAPGDYTFVHNLTASVVRSRRLLYVVDVPAAVATDWKTSVQHNKQLALPPDARIVSNRAPNMKVAQ